MHLVLLDDTRSSKMCLGSTLAKSKNFLAKRGEVFIDDLFRYLSAALLRSAPRDRRFLGSSFLLGIDSNMMIQLSSDFFMATAM